MRSRDPSGDEPMWRRYRRLLGPDVAGDVGDELSLHLELLVEEFVADGMSPEEARRAARRRFGDLETVERECLHIGRESASMARRNEWLSGLGKDLQQTVRSLARSPGFALATVLVLALGIGATTAVFSVVDSVLLRPLPYADPEEVVQLSEVVTLASGEPEEGAVSYANFLDWQARSRGIEVMAVTREAVSLTLQGRGEAERIRAVPVGANLFSVLGVGPTVGRGFAPGEDDPGAPPVAVLSHQAWRARFGADPGILGTTLTLDGRPHTVVGIMPEDFRFPAGGRVPDLWIPLAVTQEARENRGSHRYGVYGRLREGVRVEAASEELKRIAASLAQEHPQQQEGRGAVVRPYHKMVVGDVRPTLLVLLGAAGLVLLIACTNAASLLLARAVSRQREVAVRSALGASRGRIVQRFLTESLLLSGVAAAVGLLLAWLGLRAISAGVVGLLPRATEIAIDLRVVGFLVAVTLVVGIVFGLVPALQAARTSPQQGLREGGRTGSQGRAGNAFRNTLVVTQVALSLVLLVGAGLLMRTFVALVSTESGMRTEEVLTLRMALPGDAYETEAEALSRFYAPMLERVRALPGVGAAGVINMLPLQDWGLTITLGIAGKAYSGVAEMPSFEIRFASDGLLEALGVPVLRGRDFGAEDRPGAPPVALINHTAAERYFPGEDPLGQRITSFGPDTLTIVGVVGDVRQSGLDAPPQPEVYVQYMQVPWEWPAMTLVVGTSLDPAGLAPEVRRAIREVDPNLPVFDVMPMDEVVSESVADRRLYLWLLASFAAVAMALAIAGIYGVVSYSVTQRTREFGIRLALGSGAERVRGMVVWQGGRLVLLGLLVGLPAAYVLTRLLAGLLYGVGNADPLTYLAVSLSLGAVALMASYVPARRATRVDPAIALRSE